jgi:NADPH-dependent F420 reductase
MATRWAGAGLPVVIGSRAADRAESAAAGIAEQTDSRAVRGAENGDCAASADVVLLAVPFDGHAELCKAVREHVAGKIVIDCVNALGFDERGPYALDIPEGSAAEQAAGILASSRLVAAFHHVSSALLTDLSVADVATDVLVLGDDREATDTVRALADLVPGMRGVYGGRLRNAKQVEALTANLIAINRRYKTHAGVRVTGV